jgi:hypothetical protein
MGNKMEVTYHKIDKFYASVELYNNLLTKLKENNASVKEFFELIFQIFRKFGIGQNTNITLYKNATSTSLWDLSINLSEHVKEVKKTHILVVKFNEDGKFIHFIGKGDMYLILNFLLDRVKSVMKEEIENTTKELEISYDVVSFICEVP